MIYRNSKLVDSIYEMSHEIAKVMRNSQVLYENLKETTLVGYPPIYFKSDGTAISEYQINGDTVQSGTPTPENPVEVLGVGDRTANLFDEDNTDGIIPNAFINQSGETVSNTHYYMSYLIKVNPGEIYTWRFNADYLPSTHFAPTVAFYDSNKELFSVAPHDSGTKYFYFEIPANCAYIRCPVYTPYGSSALTMLNSGSTALPYEPYGYKIPITLNSVTQNVYIDSPLYEGDYIKRNADGSGVVHRGWRKLVLTGGETYAKQGGASSTLYSYNLLSGEKAQARDLIKCSHLPFSWSYSTTISIHIYSSLVTIFLNLGVDVMNAQPSGNTVAGLKEYIAAQYAAGTPVTVYYQLATPTDTPIILPQLSAVKGNNELNISTTVTPEVTLKGKIKQLPDSNMNALLSVMEEM